MSLANNSNDQDVPLQVSHFNFGGLPLELQDKIMSTVHNQDSGFTIRMKEIDEFYDDQGDPIDHGYYGRGINSMFLCGNKFLSNLAAQYVFGTLHVHGEIDEFLLFHLGPRRCDCMTSIVFFGTVDPTDRGIPASISLIHLLTNVNNVSFVRQPYFAEKYLESYGSLLAKNSPKVKTLSFLYDLQPEDIALVASIIKTLPNIRRLFLISSGAATQLLSEILDFLPKLEVLFLSNSQTAAPVLPTYTTTRPPIRSLTLDEFSDSHSFIQSFASTLVSLNLTREEDVVGGFQTKLQIPAFDLPNLKYLKISAPLDIAAVILAALSTSPIQFITILTPGNQASNADSLRALFRFRPFKSTLRKVVHEYKSGLTGEMSRLYFSEGELPSERCSTTLFAACPPRAAYLDSDSNDLVLLRSAGNMVVKEIESLTDFIQRESSKLKLEGRLDELKDIVKCLAEVVKLRSKVEKD